MTYDFDGDTYVAKRDGARLSTQMECVFEVMLDGEWHTLPELREAIMQRFGKDCAESGISARIRDFRKPRTHAILGAKLDSEREYVANGLHRYRLVRVVS